MGFVRNSNSTSGVDSRNVVDRYKTWKTEAIRADVERKRCQRSENFSVLVCNWQNNFNVGCVIRAANAFLANSVIIYGAKNYNRRATVGTHHYSNISCVRRTDSLEKLSASFNIVAFDNIPGAVPLDDFKWPPNTLMAFGEESTGLKDDVLELAKSVVYIRQFGSVRSLNVAGAAHIAMYDWCRKMIKRN